MKRIIKTGLIAALLIAVMVFVGSCIPAEGDESANSSTSTIYMIGFLVVIFGLFYFVMIRPQRKRQKEQQEMIASMQKGDRVVTAGGIYGIVDSIREDSVVIKVEGGTLLRIAKGSVMVLRDQMEMKR